jgi:hypothetical protein
VAHIRKDKSQRCLTVYWQLEEESDLICFLMRSRNKLFSIFHLPVLGCELGFKTANFREMDKCSEAYRLYCVEEHGICAEDNSHMHFDLE